MIMQGGQRTMCSSSRILSLAVALLILLWSVSGCGPSPSVPTPTPIPITSLLTSGGLTVHTLCLQVAPFRTDTQNVPDQAIEETALRILSKMGIEVVAPGSPCDATLTLSFSGTARSAKYTTGSCYTAAEASGEMTISFPGLEDVFAFRLQGVYPPADLISGCPSPSQAPFSQAWGEALIRGLARLWGPTVYVYGLGDEIPGVARVSFREVEAMGPDERQAVPALIDALGHPTGHVRGAAHTALVHISGQDFDLDTDRWQAWWEGQQ